MPSWKTQEARDRLIAALVASIDAKSLNYRRIASFYGEGTTYDAIEGQFRSIRKHAEKLKEERESEGRDDAPPRGAGSSAIRRKAESSANSGPNKKVKTKCSGPKRDAVLTGRVTKSKSITPTNNKTGTASENAVRGFKQEIESSDCSLVNTPTNPFDIAAYDGACDSFMGYELSFDDTFDGSFGSDASYMFEA